MAHLRVSANAFTMARTSLETIDFTHLTGRGKRGAATDVNTMRRDNIRRVAGLQPSTLLSAAPLRDANGAKSLVGATSIDSPKDAYDSTQTARS